MEQEVFVPVPAERLRAALADPAQVARAVPGLQQDAGTEPVAGRLKLRVGGHTITYRGALRVVSHDDGTYGVEGDATEARGTGAVRLRLTVRPRATGDGTTLRFEGTATADGRIAELPAETVGTAVARLLSRFAENLAEAADVRPPQTEVSPPGVDTAATATDTAADTAADTVEETPAGGESDTETAGGAADGETAGGAAAGGAADGVGRGDAGPAGEPPAEAAHARRTMIGRSAEEVDHAPPRGRYAPVPAPQTVAPGNTLRWAAPAAAFVVASAIVVGRALRRRR
jgi:carbon monoxide dehydrogenase subunit G